MRGEAFSKKGGERNNGQVVEGKKKMRKEYWGHRGKKKYEIVPKNSGEEMGTLGSLR